MKPGIIIIIMIHSELHNHFSLINVTALLSFLKAAGSSNLTVHKNSLGHNNFLVDVAHTHLHTLCARGGGTLQLKIWGRGAGLANIAIFGQIVRGF